MTRAGGAGAATTYGYDAHARLTSLVQNPDGTANDVTLGFAYNPAGQITGRSVSNDGYVHTLGGVSETYYRNGLNQITAINSASVTYDANQNATSVSGNTYAYDAANRLTSATPSGGSAASFVFDPLSRLASSTVSSMTTRYQYAGAQLAAEYDAAGAVTRRYVPGLGLDGVVTAYTGPGVATRDWLLADERGSVMALSGSNGAVSTINRYDEYGTPASGNAGRFGYTGQPWMVEAGAWHYRARTYLPQIGRFLQPDPIGYAAGQNLYGYVGMDPVNLVDPSGTDVCQTLYRYTYRVTATGEVIGTIYRWETAWCPNSRESEPRDQNILVESATDFPRANQQALCRSLNDQINAFSRGLNDTDVWSRNWDSIRNVTSLAAIAEATYENDAWGEPVANVLGGVGVAAAGRFAAGRAAGTRFSAYATFSRNHQMLNDGLLGAIGAGAGSVAYSMSRQRSEDRYRALESRANFLRAGCNA